MGAIREALAGTHRDYTEGDIGRAIVLLAIPMVLELCLESVFAVVDVFFVARLGPDAIATVGLTESMLIILYAVAMGLSMGATAIVARRIGEHDRDGANRAAVQAAALALVIAVPVGIFGALFADSLLRLMGATPGVIANSAFTRIVLGANGVIMMLFLLNAVFRGAGDAALAMRVLWLANIINICLDPCLIFGLGPFPRLGVAGAAVATTTGRGVAVVLQCYWLARGRGRIGVERRHLRLDPPVMLNMARLSGSAMLQALISNVSWLGLVRILASFGSAALAGYTIAFRIVIFAILPSWGVANAATTLVGQNLGAGHPQRAAESAWKACRYNMVFLGVVGAIFVVFARPLVAWFSTDPDVITLGAQGLRIISSGFLFYAYGMVLTQAFNGAGDMMTPTIINLVCFWLWEIPVAFALSRWAGLGPKGIYWAIATAYSAMAVLSAILFKRGRWQLKRV